MWKKLLIVLVLIGGGWWFIQYLKSPAPGSQVPDMGQEHVALAVVEQTTYNSNPPTSGPHYEIASKPGIYKEPQHDGQLIHSLEHGYIIISYNCGVHLTSSVIPGLTRNPWGSRIAVRDDIVRSVFAHEGEEEGSSASDLISPIATGSAISASEDCKTLIIQLEAIATKNRLWKLIVVPRPQLDTTIALTAWGYIDKFDDFDAERIERFINYHRDQGPEKTME